MMTRINMTKTDRKRQRTTTASSLCLLLLLQLSCCASKTPLALDRRLAEQDASLYDGVNLPKCLAALHDADTSSPSDDWINSTEHLTFLHLMGLPHYHDEKPLLLVGKFQYLACLCETRGASRTCCVGSNAGLDLSGLILDDTSGTYSAATQADMDYFYTICLFTEQGIQAIVKQDQGDGQSRSPTALPMTLAPTIAPTITQEESMPLNASLLYTPLTIIYPIALLPQSSNDDVSYIRDLAAAMDVMAPLVLEDDMGNSRRRSTAAQHRPQPRIHAHGRRLDYNPYLRGGRQDELIARGQHSHFNRAKEDDALVERSQQRILQSQTVKVQLPTLVLNADSIDCPNEAPESATACQLVQASVTVVSLASEEAQPREWTDVLHAAIDVGLLQFQLEQLAPQSIATVLPRSTVFGSSGSDPIGTPADQNNNDASNTGDDRMSTGAAVGILIAVVASLGIILFFLLDYWHRRQVRQRGNAVALEGVTWSHRPHERVSPPTEAATEVPPSLASGDDSFVPSPTTIPEQDSHADSVMLIPPSALSQRSEDIMFDTYEQQMNQVGGADGMSMNDTTSSGSSSSRRLKSRRQLTSLRMASEGSLALSAPPAVSPESPTPEVEPRRWSMDDGDSPLRGNVSPSDARMLASGTSPSHATDGSKWRQAVMIAGATAAYAAGTNNDDEEESTPQSESGIEENVAPEHDQDTPVASQNLSRRRLMPDDSSGGYPPPPPLLADDSSGSAGSSNIAAVVGGTAAGVVAAGAATAYVLGSRKENSSVSSAEEDVAGGATSDPALSDMPDASESNSSAKAAPQGKQIMMGSPSSASTESEDVSVDTSFDSQIYGSVSGEESHSSGRLSTIDRDTHSIEEEPDDDSEDSPDIKDDGPPQAVVAAGDPHQSNGGHSDERRAQSDGTGATETGHGAPPAGDDGGISPWAGAAIGAGAAGVGALAAYGLRKKKDSDENESEHGDDSDHSSNSRSGSVASSATGDETGDASNVELAIGELSTDEVPVSPGAGPIPATAPSSAGGLNQPTAKSGTSDGAAAGVAGGLAGAGALAAYGVGQRSASEDADADTRSSASSSTNSSNSYETGTSESSSYYSEGASKASEAESSIEPSTAPVPRSYEADEKVTESSKFAPLSDQTDEMGEAPLVASDSPLGDDAAASAIPATQHDGGGLSAGAAAAIGAGVVGAGALAAYGMSKSSASSQHDAESGSESDSGSSSYSGTSYSSSDSSSAGSSESDSRYAEHNIDTQELAGMAVPGEQSTGDTLSPGAVVAAGAAGAVVATGVGTAAVLAASPHSEEEESLESSSSSGSDSSSYSSSYTGDSDSESGSTSTSSSSSDSQSETTGSHSQALSTGPQSPRENGGLVAEMGEVTRSSAFGDSGIATSVALAVGAAGAAGAVMSRDEDDTSSEEVSYDTDSNTADDNSEPHSPEQGKIVSSVLWELDAEVSSDAGDSRATLPRISEELEEQSPSAASPRLRYTTERERSASGGGSIDPGLVAAAEIASSQRNLSPFQAGSSSDSDGSPSSHSASDESTVSTVSAPMPDERHEKVSLLGKFASIARGKTSSDTDKKNESFDSSMGKWIASNRDDKSDHSSASTALSKDSAEWAIVRSLSVLRNAEETVEEWKLRSSLRSRGSSSSSKGTSSLGDSEEREGEPRKGKEEERKHQAK